MEEAVAVLTFRGWFLGGGVNVGGVRLRVGLYGLHVNLHRRSGGGADGLRDRKQEAVGMRDKPELRK